MDMNMECKSCRATVSDLGKCECEEAFVVSHNQQDETNFYTIQLLRLLRCFVGAGLADLPPLHATQTQTNQPPPRDYANNELENLNEMENLTHVIQYHSNGLRIRLHIWTPFPARISINNNQHDNVHNNQDENDEGEIKCEEAGEEGNSNGGGRLVVRVRSHWDNNVRPNAILEIMGNRLIWVRILQDIESNNLHITWRFYRFQPGEEYEEEEYDQEAIFGLVDVEEEEAMAAGIVVAHGYENDYVNNEQDFERVLNILFEQDDYLSRGPPPASTTAIENLDAAHNVEVVDECCICMEKMLGSSFEEEEAKELPCGHAYHRHCIVKWLSYRNFCPICSYGMPID